MATEPSVVAIPTAYETSARPEPDALQDFVEALDQIAKMSTGVRLDSD